MVTTYKFSSFGRPCSGRLVTSSNELLVVQCRNSYGTHNLVIVDRDRGKSICHGTDAVIVAAFSWMNPKAYRKVRRFLSDRGIARDWVVCYDGYFHLKKNKNRNNCLQSHQDVG